MPSWIDDIFGVSTKPKRRLKRVAPAREVVVPREVPERRRKDEVLRQAERLSAIASIVETMDLAALVDADVDAPEAAAGALDCAIAAAVSGGDPRELVKRRRRRKPTERIDDTKQRQDLAEALERATRGALERKEVRLREQAQRNRELREFRSMAAMTRREYQRAVEQFGGRPAPPAPTTESFVSGDPLIDKAKAICEAAKAIIGGDTAEKKPHAVPVVTVSEEERDLVAKANALLADYVPSSPMMLKKTQQQQKKHPGRRDSRDSFVPFRSDLLEQQRRRLERASLGD